MTMSLMSASPQPMAPVSLPIDGAGAEAAATGESTFLAALASALGGEANTHGAAGERSTVAGESTIRDESTTTGALAGATVETLDATATQSLLFAAALPARTVTPGSSGIGESASIPSPATPDLDQLNPAFRTKLERVIQRMESEFGYRVEIVELVRSQSRQDALFESGRTRPGPVVTWTRASRHSEGRAADLRIDGSYQNSAVYQRLWQVARSEGLVTLGPQDAGHVELPGPSTQSPSAQRMTATNGAGTS
jgi:peptidoglycan L-alanyl-D-glutamate endopeptidase CwlK